MVTGVSVLTAFHYHLFSILISLSKRGGGDQASPAQLGKTARLKGSL